MEDIDKDFVRKVRECDIIVTRKNFGCVIAETFAGIFYRNSINIGLPIIERKEAAKSIDEGDVVELDFDTGVIRNKTKKRMYQGQAFPEFMQCIIRAGGLIAYVNQKLSQSENTKE